MASSILSTSSVASATSVAANPAASFIFQAVGEMYTCGMSIVHWGYAGPSASLSLNITNINVAQQAPLPASTAAASSTASVIQSGVAQLAKRQYNGYGSSYLPPINVIVASNLDPSSANWTWPEVTVPQGWYQMLANVQDVQSVSGTFFVLNGTNTNCIPQYAINPSSSSTNALVTPSASPSANLIASGHSHAGAIAGGIIGGIAFLAAAIATLLFCFLRRRQRYPRSRNDEIGNDRRWSVLPFGKSRHSSFARSSLQKAHADLPTLEAEHTILGSDEELSTVGHEKAVAVGYPTALHHEPPSYSNRVSTQTNGSNGRVSNPEPLARRGSNNAGTGAVIQLERANTNGARRKPVPRYEDADETGAKDNPPSSSHTTLESIHNNANAHSNAGNTHVLQHQSSFGAMRPMHVMIPDPPPRAQI
jgi:hypothetical protein